MIGGGHSGRRPSVGVCPLAPNAMSSLPVRPTLRPGVELFPAGNGDIFILRTDGRGDAVVRDASDHDRALFALLQEGERTVPEISEQLVARGLTAAPEPLVAELEGLNDAGLLMERVDTSALPVLDAERYDRQLRYFADAAPPDRSPATLQAALGRTRVVVIGIGGLGSWAAASLAAAGVGTIVAVDDDRVELSNLNRQILYGEPDLGGRKVDVAARRLGEINSGVTFIALPRRIRSRADVEAVIGGSDFVVATADSPAHEIDRWIDDACHAQGVPHIGAGQFPPLIRVGPCVIPGQTPCQDCIESGLREGFAQYDELVSSRQATPSAAATLAPASAVVGGLIAMEVLHHLTGLAHPATAGRALIFDLQTFATRWEPVTYHDRCGRHGTSVTSMIP